MHYYFFFLPIRYFCSVPECWGWVAMDGIKFGVTVTAKNSINCRCNWHVCPPQWQ